MTDRDYAIKSMKEITFQMATHAQNYLEVTMDRHYEDIKALMVNYQKLILENKMVLEELEMECQEKINEDMAYALSYLDVYGKQLNVTKLRHEMNNLMVIYGLSDMVYRGITLVKYYAPDRGRVRIFTSIVASGCCENKRRIILSTNSTVKARTSTNPIMPVSIRTCSRKLCIWK